MEVNYQVVVNGCLRSIHATFAEATASANYAIDCLIYAGRRDDIETLRIADGKGMEWRKVGWVWVQ